MTKKNEVALTQEQMDMLNQSYPVAEDSNRLTLPRFGMLSKDITEESGSGKNKKIKVIEAAGTFFTERDLGDTNDNGKKAWTRKYIEDESVEVIVAFHRKQLRRYDSSLEKFISTPLFDSADQVLPLYLDKQVIKRGTQKELQALYPKLTQKGKPSSDLKEELILFVLLDGELYQANISQSSKFDFLNYRKNVNPSTVVTRIESQEEQFGDNKFSKMRFSSVRSITQDEFEMVSVAQETLKEKVESDKQYFLTQATTPVAEIEAEKKFESM